MDPRPHPPLVCDHCHVVIGVYEPLVALVDGQPQVSSLAADPALGAHLWPTFHRDCLPAVSVAA